MLLPLRLDYLLFLSFLLCLELGCDGSGGSRTQPQNPVPTLSGVTPTFATAGSAALIVTASGSGFLGLPGIPTPRSSGPVPVPQFMLSTNSRLRISWSLALGRPAPC